MATLSVVLQMYVSSLFTCTFKAHYIGFCFSQWRFLWEFLNSVIPSVKTSVSEILKM